MKIPLPKLKATILYFGTHTNPALLGKVKLMKLFYYLDFMHVKKYGRPVTYDMYVNLEHGPIPSAIKNLVDSADDDIDNSVLSDTIRVERPEGLDIHRVIPLRKFTDRDTVYFSDTELDILKKVCLRYGDKNTKYVEDASHKESPWQNTHLGDYIPYTLAAKDDDCLVDEKAIKVLADIAE